MNYSNVVNVVGLILEKNIYEKERSTFNRISEMQKQINWLTSTVYNLIESNENATQAENEKSQKMEWTN